MATVATSTKTLQFNPATNSYQFVDGPSYAQVTITDPTKGIIINSTTKQWRVTINDSGALITTEIIAAP